ncbi:MAG: hypothetical protein J2P36_37050, partial [Ktedonobacteraceae bacterium]|nr:hypothetical protein [Ktedonobacteraceae bacterium]
QHARRLVRQATKLADIQRRYYYLDLHLRLPDQVVHPLQRLATQEQMVLRSPYLSARVMDVLTRLPATLADGTAKDEIATRLLRRLMVQETSSALPLNAPTGSLLSEEQTELLQQTLTEQALRTRGIFEPAAIAALRNAKRGKSAPRALLLAFTTQLFCSMFGMGM